MPFENADLIRPALTAPVCQLVGFLTCTSLFLMLTIYAQCSIRLSSVSDNTVLADSLHKTFTDCYFAPGFVGGHWATAINDDKRHYYYLGFETREVSGIWWLSCYIFNSFIQSIMTNMPRRNSSTKKWTNWYLAWKKEQQITWKWFNIYPSLLVNIQS